MFSFLKKIITYLIALVGIIAVALYFRPYFIDHFDTIAQFGQTVGQAVEQNVTQKISQDKVSLTSTAPCSAPITYSLGTFDPRFGLTQAEFLSDINTAAQIWDEPFGRTFFQYASSSPNNLGNDIKINLVYDYRQQATDAMNAIGPSIDDETTVYQALKTKYNTLDAAYASDKATFNAESASFKTAETAYNQQVAYWNARGGADPSDYATLTQEKNTLQSQAAVLNQRQQALNSEVAAVNTTATTINKYAASLNAEVSRYNSVSSSTGEEFDEGEYVVDASGRRIDIFQYSTKTKLIRVLAHELGHSLGLGHVYNNPQAIMYPLNQGTNLALSTDDIAAVKTLCGFK